MRQQKKQAGQCDGQSGVDGKSVRSSQATRGAQVDGGRMVASMPERAQQDGKRLKAAEPHKALQAGPLGLHH